MTKLLMSAFIGSDNLGDEAIFESILANIDRNGVEISATSINLARTSNKGVVAIPAKQPVALWQAIRNADVISMGGGGIIQDQSSVVNMIYYCYQLMLARIYRKPVVLSFVGVGPVSRRFSRWLFRFCSKTVKLAIVRDERSKQLLADILGGDSDIHVFHDPVLNYPIEPSAAEQDSEQVIVSLRKWFFSIPVLPAKIARRLNSLGLRSRRYDALVASLAESLDKFADNNPDVKLRFLSFYDEEDIEISHRVIEQMQHKQRCIAPESGLTTNQYVDYARQSRTLFGMRLHSLILATVAGTPFAAINYSSKVDSFTKQMHQDEYMQPVEDYQRGFHEIFQAAYDRAAGNRPTITSLRDKYRQENLEAFEMINKFIAEHGLVS